MTELVLQEFYSRELKKGIQITVASSLILSFSLILIAFDSSELLYVLIFVALAIASVYAAIKYTVGENAYGYRAFGDVFVFVFFGGVSVLGSYFLQNNTFSIELILPATSIGLLSVGVLNLNNMRDLETDKKSNKITIAVLLGSSYSKIYHAFLLIGAVFTSFYDCRFIVDDAFKTCFRIY
jgi:1,4-dihydroxy-2-naphthoate octaprenyltransferase